MIEQHLCSTRKFSKHYLSILKTTSLVQLTNIWCTLNLINRYWLINDITIISTEILCPFQVITEAIFVIAYTNIFKRNFKRKNMSWILIIYLEYFNISTFNSSKVLEKQTHFENMKKPTKSNFLNKSI